jgi:histidine triad (HIT) family protein
MDDCVFCQILDGQAPADVVYEFTDAIVIVPRHPVTPGHLLVIPRVHVQDAAEDPKVTADAAYVAAHVLKSSGGDANLIADVGPAASMTVPHLHWHLVPRREGDGLALPWTGQKRGA